VSSTAGIADLRVHHGHLAIAAVAVAVAMAAGLPAPAAAHGSVRPPTLKWAPCADPGQGGFDCATARVPLSYRRPSGPKIHLAVIRHRASDPAHRLGTLFFNPGGPGGRGTTVLPGAWKFFPAPLRARFDLVSWDPRGIGESTAVQCFASQAAEARFFGNLPWQSFPLGKAQSERWLHRYAAFGHRCERRNGALLRHVSTADTARDLDLLRRAVGGGPLNYLGTSYGTFLGATYANLFPKRVGAMALDGNLNPRQWVHRHDQENGGEFLSTWLRQGSELGSARTLGAFLGLCGKAGAAACPFSAGDPETTDAKFDALLARIRRHPAGQPVAYSDLVSEIARSLYAVDPALTFRGWTALAGALQQLSHAQKASELKATKTYAGPEQAYGVFCSESPNPPPGTFRRLTAQAVARSGAVGRYWSWLSGPCASWPAKAADRYAGPWDRPTAKPVLVIGNTHDPVTSYRDSIAMSRALARARLLTVDGYGHTALLNPSACANRYEVRYFVDGTMPAKGARCAQDVQPFAGGP
jgi:pimeloyl-ACP methyl ester carboxylesterase